MKILLNKSPYYFCLKPAEAPTFFNLSRYLQEQGWRKTRFNWLANFSNSNFHFDEDAAKTLEYKHLLAELLSQYYPQHMPLTYCINDYNWMDALNEIANTYYLQNQQHVDQINNLVWILKPSLLNNGQNIKIFSQLSQIEQHFLSSNRLGGEHVLQQYLIQPHLLKEHKYTIRMFVILTNYAGNFLYPYGYFNVALNPYEPNSFSNLSSHLTNEHLREDESNVIQIPTQRFDFFPEFYPTIKRIIADTLLALKTTHPQAFVCKKNRSVAIFGFDFMVDANKRIWLLEANHGPCFPTTDDHPLQKYLYYDFWQAFIANFVSPIANRISSEQISFSLFEQLSE